MIKVGTIGMIEKNAKSFPTIKAHADILNGWFGTINDTTTVMPSAETVKSKDLIVVMNTINNDDMYTDVTLKAGTAVNAFLLREWANQTLEVSKIHLSADLSTFSEKDILVADIDGKLVKGDATDYGVSFIVVKKTNFCGGGLIVKIVVA